MHGADMSPSRTNVSATAVMTRPGGAGGYCCGLLHLGDGTGTFTVSYGLTESNELRTATLKGPFFPGVEATYLLTMTDYGAPATITRP